jgi:hypothetical protein
MLFIQKPFALSSVALSDIPRSFACSASSGSRLLQALLIRRIEVMSSSRDAVRCTVHHGAMWMHLDNVSVKIPPELVENSQILTNALSAAHPSFARKVTVAAPKEWLQAWAVCYCNKEVSLGCEDIKDLVNCLLVCFLPLEHNSNRADDRSTVFTACLV